MKKIIMTVTMLVGAGAFASGTKAADSKAAKFDLKGDATKGEATFKQFCITCHGESGAGDGPAGAALNPKPANFTDAKRAAEITDEYVYTMIKEGGQANNRSPLMVSWKTSLNDQQIRDVAAYVRHFSKKKPAAPAAHKK